MSHCQAELHQVRLTFTSLIKVLCVTGCKKISLLNFTSSWNKPFKSEELGEALKVKAERNGRKALSWWAWGERDRRGGWEGFLFSGYQLRSGTMGSCPGQGRSDGSSREMRRFGGDGPFLHPHRMLHLVPGCAPQQRGRQRGGRRWRCPIETWLGWGGQS